MTVVAGTTTTFASIGLREDLEDTIYNISPMETPFQTRAGRSKATATYHEWQTDALASAAKNAAIQGDDASYTTAVPTTRLRDYCQILQKTALISGTQDAVDKAGRDTELAYQMAMRSKELKRDLEYALVRNQVSTAAAYGATAMMAGLESWIATNKTSVGTGTSQTTPGYASGTVLAPTDSTVAGSLTESALKSVIQAIWTAGGDPKLFMVGPATKAKMSTSFTGLATRFSDVKGDTQASIIAGADVYVSDFGRHEIVANRFMRDQNVLCLDMDYWELRQLRPLKINDLAVTGDSIRKQLIMEVTLASLNEKASGKVCDVNPAI